MREIAGQKIVRSFARPLCDHPRTVASAPTVVPAKARDIIVKLRTEGRKPADCVREICRLWPDVGPRRAYTWCQIVAEHVDLPPVARRGRSAHMPPKPVDGAIEAPATTVSRATIAEPSDLEPPPPGLDDIVELERVRDAVASAMREWEKGLGYNPSSVMQHSRLTRVLTDLTARLVELRPRPEVDAERMAALGAEARDALLARARDAAAPSELAELRSRVAAQAAVIDQLRAAMRRSP